MLDTLMQADELGVRLEIMGGLPIWEAHQKALDRIRASFPVQRKRRSGKRPCDCVHASDV